MNMATCLYLLTRRVCQNRQLLKGAVKNAEKNILFRSYSGPCRTVTMEKVDLWEEYHKTKQRVAEEPLPRNRDPDAVYANNELDLSEIDVYGFDYDYTLMNYKKSLHYLIYDLGCRKLVEQHKYPERILNLKYDPTFAIRGLHCDVRKGLLLKIDSFHDIQMGTVYRGHTCLPDDEVKQLYNGSHVGIMNMNSFYGTGPNMHQMMDLFSVPEMTLFSNVIQYFIDNDLAYDPEYVFYDVKSAVQDVHSSGRLHQTIIRDMTTYMDPDVAIVNLLTQMTDSGKRIFLITNNSADFVNRGMNYLVGPQWNKMFDVIVTNARKPKFFYQYSRPFRSFDHRCGAKSWTKVESLQKGRFYQEGNFMELNKLTDWQGARVLYFGDHVYADLADATLKHGWRTGAIIPELAEEVNTINSKVYKESVRWLSALEGLIETMQDQEMAESQEVIKEWVKERQELRVITKNIFNPQFGSLFRTYHNPTYFSRRLNRFADVYMSSVTSLLNYSLDHTFYPRRTALPHELHGT